MPRADLDAHLATCGECRAFAGAAARLHRRTRVVPATPVPDRTAEILHAIGQAVPSTQAVPAALPAPSPAASPALSSAPPTPEPHDDRVQLLRWCLGIVGAIQLAMAVPALILGDDAGLPTHVARHLGSFTVALAVALLLVAWRPGRAAGLLPFVGVLVLCLVGSSVVDVAEGYAVAGSELSHVPELVGLLAVWFLARWAPAPVGPRRPILG